MEDSTNVTKSLNATDLSSAMDNDPCIIRESGDESKRDFFHFLIYGICLNSVGILGLIGNIISITILSRSNMRSSINCCLVGLASFDSILLVTSLLLYGLPAIPEYTNAITWYTKYLFPWIALVGYPLGIIAQTGSVYLTVTVTVERYVAVCHPLKARSLCTYGRAKVYVLIVALFSLLYNLPRFWEVTYRHCSEGVDKFTVIDSTELRREESYIQIYITWLYLLVMYLFPFLSLLIFNTFIYRQIRLANHERQRLSRLQKKELGLAVMLLCVVIVFFLCNILAFIVSVLEMFDIVLAYLTMTNNFLVTVNSSVNFVIYCIFGQKFRRLFLEIFCFGALNPYSPSDCPLNESGFGGNSMYGEGRPLTNGRSTNTRSIRLSSLSVSQGNRLSSNATWHGGRCSMPVIGNFQDREYKHVSHRDSTGCNRGENLTKTNSRTVPPIDPLIEKDEKSDIV